jgi:hypothetical protein
MKNDCHLVLTRHDEEVSSVLCFDREVPIRDSGKPGRRFVGLRFGFDEVTEDGVRVGKHCNMQGEAAAYAELVLDTKNHIDGCDNDGCGADLDAELIVGPVVSA